MTLRCCPALVCALLIGCAAETPTRRILPNDNLIAAGQSRGPARIIDLEIREGDWYPESDTGLSEPVLAFAESGKALQVPGPMIRATAGTRIRASVTNHSTDTLVVHLPADSILLPPGVRDTLSFSLDSAGTWFYWAGLPGQTIVTRHGFHTQLGGALIVDPPGVTRPADRVFVLSEWNQPIDTTGPKPWVPRDLMTINGRMWPYTERFTYEVGDSVHWRWLNASNVNHPMHLHGFYYDVLSKGDWRRDTTYTAEQRRRVVTETLTPGETMTMAWQAERAGNWLFHCHFAFHVSHFLSLHKIPDPDDPGGPDAMSHSPHMMTGLVLGLVVKPKTASALAPSRRPEQSEGEARGARHVRLVAREIKRPIGKEEYYYSVQGDDIVPRSDSSTLILTRGEPVRLTVVNQLRAATAVHWHGIEVANSYNDGVPDWSGSGSRLAPSIAPGDSFTAEFTPPRSGTFMYHSHSNEIHQIAHGMYGALLVVDQPVDTATERLAILGGDDVVTYLNRSTSPAPIGMVAGRTYRLRIINIQGGYTFHLSLESPAGRLTWRPLAKDGADLPAAQATEREARAFMGPGESADFEVTPRESGKLRLHAESPGGDSKIDLPIVVSRR
jgi:FtsP/CotA-like multicopper oxidase with cupredoxin domain